MNQLPLGQLGDDGWRSGSASFSKCERYRYRLTRTWGRGAMLTWVMLNPSTADAFKDDPTIRRVLSFSRQAIGVTTVQIVNLFALRATDPAKLLEVDDPVGPDNDFAIERSVLMSDVTVAAWGAHAMARERGDAFLEWMKSRRLNVFCLGLTKDGSPRHPLYVPASQRLVLMTVGGA